MATYVEKRKKSSELRKHKRHLRSAWKTDDYFFSGNAGLSIAKSSKWLFCSRYTVFIGRKKDMFLKAMKLGCWPGTSAKKLGRRVVWDLEGLRFVGRTLVNLYDLYARIPLASPTVLLREANKELQRRGRSDGAFQGSTWAAGVWASLLTNPQI